MAMRRNRVAALVLLTAAPVILFGLRPAEAQQVHRNGFETMRTMWVKSAADAPYEEAEHTITDIGPYDGQRCEYIKLEAREGNFIYYQYALGKAAITDELIASVFVKANRPGMQILARVVLPNERDPNNLDQRMTTLIRGELYQNVGKWQRLEFTRPVQLLKTHQHLMQNQLRREVNIDGAYIDTLYLNVYGGRGPTEVWIDDLEVGPVQEQTAAPARGPTPALPASMPRGSARAQVVDFTGTNLNVGGKPFFFRAIRYSDTPLRVLRDAGFNTLVFDHNMDAKTQKEAIDLGFWLVPTLKIFNQDSSLAAPDSINKEVTRFADSSDAVLFYNLGGTLSNEQTSNVSRAVQIIKAADPTRPLAAEVWDGLTPYSRILPLVGIYRWPLMTTLELSQYREWLDQRRRLANPGTFVWTWIQTHLPDWYTYMLYNQPPNAAFKDAVGPQPDQIRLLTYTALAAGCRGLGFWSDRFLADSHAGRDRLHCVANLNMELEMLEPLLVGLDGEPQWIDAKTEAGAAVKDVKAAVFRTAKGILVLPMWQGPGAQFVPGQAAVSKLMLVVPQVPASTQAWEITPGEVKHLRAERVTGGTKVVIPEFGLTTAILFTSETSSVIHRFQEQCRSRRQLAAQWTYDQTFHEYQKVLKIEELLEKQGHVLNDGRKLMQDAENRLRTARKHWEERQFGEAYREAQRAMRPIRILMRAQWEEAIKRLDTPVASPFAVSYYTLPRHWEFMHQISASTPSANVLPGGDFEIIAQRTQEAWQSEETTLDDVDLTATRVGEVIRPLTTQAPNGVASQVEQPKQGKQCLMLQVRPRNRVQPPRALERTLLAINSPPVRLEPGTLVRISGWINVPAAITASPDGALFYDSAGGEPLAVRLTEPMPWKPFVLYRRVPASGMIQVTCALTGVGTVYFDDVRIEPMVPAAATPTSAPSGSGFAPRQ
jgi:hypothetical protein